MASSKWRPNGQIGAGATAFKKRESTLQLFDLPVELFREILYGLDPASFCICLQTSRLFHQHALSSIDLLVTQILRIPGPWDESLLRRSSADHLLALFRKNAAKHLKHGSWMTDMHIWNVSFDVDSRNSSIMHLEWNACPGTHKPRQTQAFVQVQRFLATIHIYYIEHHDTYGSAPRLKHIISQESVSNFLPLGGGDPFQCKVLKTATWVPWSDSFLETRTPLLAVLYCGRLPLVGEEWRRLLILNLDEKFGPTVVEQYTLEGANKSEHVVAMAISSNREPILLYQCEGSYGCGYRLAVLKVDHEMAERGTYNYFVCCFIH